MNRLRDLALQALSSLWFVPLGIALAMACAAFGCLGLDAWLDGEGSGRLLLDTRSPLFGDVGVAGARAMLSTSAGALVTVAGVALSGVLVALSIASGQYTSRVLRTFTASRVHQTALGVTLGSFVYCLIVLRAVGSSADGAFVPEVSVFLALPLTLASVAALLLFAHGTARSIQASELLAAIAEDTIESAERWFTAGSKEPGAVAQAREIALPATRRGVASATSGYIREVDGHGLAEIAERLGGVIVVEKEVGEFVVAGDTVVSVEAPLGPESLDPELREALLGHLRIGTFRTAEQDPAFGIRQLVDIALKALSPGVNDVTTAEMAMHRVIEVLSIPARSASRPSQVTLAGQLRVMAPRRDFGRLLELAFEEVLRASAEHPRVLATVAEGWVVLDRAAAGCPTGESRRLLRRFVAGVRPFVEAHAGAEPALESSERTRTALTRLSGDGPAPPGA